MTNKWLNIPMELIKNNSCKNNKLTGIHSLENIYSINSFLCVIPAIELEQQLLLIKEFGAQGSNPEPP